ncbi:hypothetical protein niasHS_015610 [Heterodera schachtii]|uniref:Uncharacterized protein n=1 Tax=Heterodera schachtii TaxID=97005 RepID=A0ABD2HU24_HETSC
MCLFAFHWHMGHEQPRAERVCRSEEFKGQCRHSPGAMDESVEADDGGGTDFQHLLDLALPKIEDLDNSTTNCSAEDENDHWPFG